MMPRDFWEEALPVAEEVESPYPLMFSPLQVGAHRLRNRVVHASMSTYFVRDREVTQRFVDYHASRARGGAAMIVTEPVSIAPWQTADNRLAVYDQQNLDGLKRVAEAVEGEDCRLLAQIQDSGRGRHKPGRNTRAIGPSARPDDWSWTVPHVMTADDVKRFVDYVSVSAKKLQVAGWSGVEISAGHGHLFHQFMSPWSNHREDDYGGSLDNRLRFVREMIEVIRAECGPGFILGLKMAGDDGVPGGIGPDEAEDMVRWFAAKAPPDFLCFCQGSHHRSLEMHLPDLHWPRGTFFELIKRLRDAADGIPVVAVGRILEPAQGEALLADGVAELVGLGRTMVTDAAWALKSMQGRDNDIRKCVSCNNCWGAINEGQPLQCDNNPRVGEPDEVDWWPKPAAKKRRVVVVGGGIAGLEAAWVAAARGHDVTLFGASAEAGGKTRLNALLPDCEALSSIYDYQLVAAGQAGVTLELGWRAGAGDVLALKPDAVVLAAGATMSWPDCLPTSLREEGFIPDLRETVTEILAHPGKQSGTAVIFDHDHLDGTYSAAEFLRDKFDRVVILTAREQIARDEPVVRAQSIYRRMYEKGVEIILLSEPCGESDLIEGRLSYRNVFTGAVAEIEDVALFTYSTPRIPDAALLQPLQAAGVEVHLVGDCYTPRSAMTATQEGHAAGNQI